MRYVGADDMKVSAANKAPQVNTAFRVIAETEDTIVVDKPPNLLVHPTKPGGPPTLWDGLRHLLAYEIVNGGQVSIINRLDRETSGVTLVCKNAEAARRFGKLMQRRRFHKEYVAIVFGWPVQETFTVDKPILRQGDVRESRVHLKQTVHPDGAFARTDFRVLRRFERHLPGGEPGRFSLVLARPVTGRMHQIRVHLAHRGHGIVGDKLYGAGEECYLRFIDEGWSDWLERRLLLPRQALHARALAVSTADEKMRWESPLPEDLELWTNEGQS